MINWDVDYSNSHRKYVVFVDLGEEVLSLTRSQLQEMIDALVDAEESV
jgi:hypothetical protein